MTENTKDTYKNANTPISIAATVKQTMILVNESSYFQRFTLWYHNS